MHTQNLNRSFRASSIMPMLATAIIALWFMTPPAQAGGRNPNPGVVSPHGTFRGLSYGEWGAQWWTASLTIPVTDGDHPLFSGGAFGE